MLRLLESAANILGWIASTVSRVMLLSVATMLFVQVVLRYVFGFSLPWPEEAARYLMIWVVMLSGSLLVKDEQLVSVDFFDKFWTRRLLIYRNALFRLLLCLLLGILVWQGFDSAMSSINRTTTALRISWFWPYFAIPVGALLMLFHMIVLTVGELLRGKPLSQDSSLLRSEV